jgi:hypothetical protein
MEPTKKELVLAASFTLLLLLLIEIGLRVLHVEFQTEFFALSRQRGWVLRPGTTGEVTTENKQHVHINSNGFHDKERTLATPIDTVRIAVLGNSWTEAMQIPLDKTFPSLLEKKFSHSECFGGRNVEVLNFGVSGYSTAQELLTLQQEVVKYHPDIVLATFYAARDVANNVREFNNTTDPAESPYFVLRDGQLVLDDSFRNLPALQGRQIMMQTVRASVAAHIKVLQAINSLVLYGRARVAALTTPNRAQQTGIDNIEFATLKPPSQPQMENAWRITEALIVAMRDEAHKQNADFRVVTLATRPQVNPDLVQRTAFTKSLGVSDLSYADKRIQTLGEKEHIAVTTLAPSLSAYAVAHHQYLNGFDALTFGAGHWNETGHELAAEAIAADMCGQPNEGIGQLTSDIKSKSQESHSR